MVIGGRLSLLQAFISGSNSRTTFRGIMETGKGSRSFHSAGKTIFRICR